MRTAILPIALLVTLALTACGKSEPEVDARNASVAEVAGEVREATREGNLIRPGKWLSEVTVEEISAPGMPPQVREQMQGMLAKQNSFESCLTSEEAKRPKEDFFAGRNNQCRYEHFTMGDGKIDAKMRCDQQGTSQVMELAGTYSADSYRMSMSTRTEGGGAAEGMTMKMRIDAKRVGECSAKQT